MEKEKAVNKAIELEFGIGNAKSIREHNSSLVKVAEHLYDLLQPSTPPDFDIEVYNWLREHGSDETRQLIEMTARHFWGMGSRDERMEMMKDAMEGIVIDEDMFGNKICVVKIPKDSRFQKRDVVKVIILKAEEEK